MKILLLHQFFISQDEPGGSRHIETLKFFQNQGHEVTVIAGSVNYMTNQSKLRFGKFYLQEKISEVYIHWVYCIPWLTKGVLGKLLSYLSFFLFALPVALTQKADIVIASSPPPTVAFLGWLLSRQRKVPWILEIRDWWPNVGVELGALSEGFMLKILQKGLNSLYHSASHIITLTFGIEQALQQYVSPSKITTIPNGVDQTLFRGITEIPELKQLSSSKKIILYVGAMGIANNTPLLVKLAKIFQDNENVFFIFVGDGSQRPAIESIAVNENLTNVKFWGIIPRKNIPTFLSYATLCIATWSRGKAFRFVISNKLLDYMASGKPVLLAAEEGDASEILEKAKGGVRVDPDDIEEMSRCVVHWLEHPEEAKAMGERGKAHVLEHFSRENLAKQYLQVIKNVVERSF